MSPIERHAVVVVAHADDLEIGAGGTVAKLLANRWKVTVVIATDEDDSVVAETRRREAAQALQCLGGDPTSLRFLGMPDGKLLADRDSIGAVRQIFKDNVIDLVITHSLADDHQDHKRCHEIVCGAFRSSLRIYFGVVNHLVKAKFQPKMFVEVSSFSERQTAALNAHKSQIEKGRILFDRIEEHRVWCASQGGITRGEGFEIDIPANARGASALVTELNDSVFHRFWNPYFENGELVIVNSEPVSRRRPSHRWKPHYDDEARRQLSRAFDRYSSVSQIRFREERASTAQAEEALYSQSVILIGGPVSNSLTRGYFNHFEGIRYVVNYTMPDYRDIRIEDRNNNAKPFRAEYALDQLSGGFSPVRDFGIATSIVNPCHPESRMLAVMGIHGFGTCGAMAALTDDSVLAELAAKVESSGAAEWQVLTYNTPRDGKSGLILESFHVIR